MENRAPLNFEEQPGKSWLDRLCIAVFSVAWFLSAALFLAVLFSLAIIIGGTAPR